MIKQSTLVSFMAAAGVALFGAQAAQAQQIVKIDGSSTVYPLSLIHIWVMVLLLNGWGAF